MDFAEEDSFIRWARHGDPEAAAFWEQWLKDHPDKQEAVQEAARLVRLLKVREIEPTAAELQSIWSRIDAAIEAPAMTKTPARRIFLRAWLPYAAAAASVALILFFLFNDPSRDLVIPNGEQMAFTLPDGSAVKANAGSTLSYQPRTWKKERRIQLNGEAFFEVKKGKPFIVETSHGNIEVLGTKFNVQAREGAFRVDCLSGKVRVTTPSKSVQVLTAGRSTQQTNAGLLAEPVTLDTALIASWRDGRFYFENAALKEVFDEISRQYKVEIRTSAEVMRRRTTTFFELGSLDSALYKVCWPMQLEARRKGNVVTVQ